MPTIIIGEAVAARTTAAGTTTAIRTAKTSVVSRVRPRSAQRPAKLAHSAPAAPTSPKRPMVAVAVVERGPERTNAIVVQKALKAAKPSAPKRMRRRSSGSVRNSWTVEPQQGASSEMDGRSCSPGSTRRQHDGHERP